MKAYHDMIDEVLQYGSRKENRTGVDTISTFNHNYELSWDRRLRGSHTHYVGDSTLKGGVFDEAAGVIREEWAHPIPLLTTKEVSWKNIVVEMLWFLSGDPTIEILQRHKCKFWDAWADEDGTVPMAYGEQWRRFPILSKQPLTGRAHIATSGYDGAIPYCHADDPRMDDSDPCYDSNALPENWKWCEACAEVWEKKHPGTPLPAAKKPARYTLTPGINDQIEWVLNQLRKSPMNRRLVVSAWAPEQAQTAKLPPCHLLFVFNVQNVEVNGKVEQRLCLHLTQRSCDLALGVPYNMASYGLLLLIMSHLTGIKPGIFAHTLLDLHIYTSKPDGSMAEYDHIPGLKEQRDRNTLDLPTLTIDPSIRELSDIEALMAKDVTTEDILTKFQLNDYKPHEAIKFKVAV